MALNTERRRLWNIWSLVPVYSSTSRHQPLKMASVKSGKIENWERGWEEGALALMRRFIGLKKSGMTRAHLALKLFGKVAHESDGQTAGVVALHEHLATLSEWNAFGAAASRHLCHIHLKANNITPLPTERR